MLARPYLHFVFYIWYFVLNCIKLLRVTFKITWFCSYLKGHFFFGTKFNIKDKTSKEHQHDLTYSFAFPDTNYNEE